MFLTGANDAKDLVYVVDKQGLVWVLENMADVLEKHVLFDVRSLVTSTKSEEGLLGFAFDPDFANDPYVYLNYTKNQTTFVSRMTLGESGVDPLSEVVVLTFKQPYANHNGGDMAFGPDGYLYIASGDGGSAGDPRNNSQNLTNLLGKILRIDVRSVTDTQTYTIPDDNPFVGNDQGYAPEIYAYGLRNPWRLSFV